MCFVLDNSWSIHAERMVEKAKGLVFRLLEDATGNGDRVALVAFRGGVPEATVALPLTRSLPLAYRRLREVPLSGQTPLADALRRGRILLRQELSKHPNAVPLVVAVTDGLATRPLRPDGDPMVDTLTEARALRRARVPVVVADTGPRGVASRDRRRRGRRVDAGRVPLAGRPARDAGANSVSRDRQIEWAAQTVTQGEILDAFCIYCEGIDDLEVLENEALFLRLSWRRRPRNEHGGDRRHAAGRR